MSVDLQTDSLQGLDDPGFRGIPVLLPGLLWIKDQEVNTVFGPKVLYIFSRQNPTGSLALRLGQLQYLLKKE